jgi:1-acyl-sn-glycerol-3-phosphate acyltransferase
MIGMLRLVLALAVFSAATPPLALWQMVALRSRALDERRAPRLWHRLVTKLLGMRIRVHGAPAEGRPLLIVSNHVSWTDIMVLGSVADVHFIAKSEVAGWPVMGRLSKLQGTVFVERQSRRKAGAQAGEIAVRLADGAPLVLFPEGTTSDGTLPLAFKSTLFAAADMALREGGAETVTIQPVAIAYTRLHGLPMGRRHRGHVAWIGDQELLPHLLALLRQGGLELEVHFGEPVEFRSGASRKDAAREVERRVRAMLAQALRGRG